MMVAEKGLNSRLFRERSALSLSLSFPSYTLHREFVLLPGLSSSFLFADRVFLISCKRELTVSILAFASLESTLLKSNRTSCSR